MWLKGSRLQQQRKLVGIKRQVLMHEVAPYCNKLTLKTFWRDPS
jgi:hypothetical protein